MLSFEIWILTFFVFTTAALAASDPTDTAVKASTGIQTNDNIVQSINGSKMKNGATIAIGMAASKLRAYSNLTGLKKKSIALSIRFSDELVDIFSNIITANFAPFSATFFPFPINSDPLAWTLALSNPRNFFANAKSFRVQKVSTIMNSKKGPWAYELYDLNLLLRYHTLLGGVASMKQLLNSKENINTALNSIVECQLKVTSSLRTDGHHQKSTQFYTVISNSYLHWSNCGTLFVHINNMNSKQIRYFNISTLVWCIGNFS